MSPAGRDAAMTTLATPTPTGFEPGLLDAMPPGPSWVSDARRAAAARLASLPLPDRRAEHWMRTDLRTFQPRVWAEALARRPATAEMPAAMLGDAVAAAGTGPRPFAGRVASIDGHVVLDEHSPELAASGVVFGAPERILEAHGDRLRSHWFANIDASSDFFAALHGAFHRAGAVIVVPAGVRLATPLHVLSALGSGTVDTSHILVVLDEGAEATVITETAGGGESGLHCGGTEIVVGRGASLRMVSLQNWSRGVWHFARQRAVVGEAGRLQWTLAALGGRLAQVQQDVVLAGRGADAQVNGVMFTEARQQLIANTLQHHVAPGCRSDLLYKGALQDRSRLVWRGMIKVDPAAQKTDGYQRNDTLMLSKEARADSIPGLEIEADDVRCTHGATSGRVDDEQIFYARSRGLSADEAARLVVAGFFQQVFDRITIAPVREALSAAIGGRIRRVS